MSSSESVFFLGLVLNHFDGPCASTRPILLSPEIFVWKSEVLYNPTVGGGCNPDSFRATFTMCTKRWEDEECSV